MNDDDAPGRTNRGEKRAQGRASATLARVLMKISDEEIRALDLSERLIETCLQVRAITSAGARRREERRLAGVLRDEGLDEVEAALAQLRRAQAVRASSFQRRERWRDRLVEDGDEAMAAFVEEYDVEDRAALVEHVEAARQEERTGKPRGARKRLFRLVAELTSAAEQELERRTVDG